ncbi:hypothetical protein JW921_10040 [Candidatus Fermentibacterales bacterium]|nr:hypothetical protein [Candidatus Fermentibacterales bacterium]
MTFLLLPGGSKRTELSRRLLRSRIAFTAALVAACALLAYLFSLGGASQPCAERFSTVGDFPPGHVWFNTPVPLSLYGELDKHITLVLFCDCASLADVQGLLRLQTMREQYSEMPVAAIIALVNPSTDLDSLRGVIATWGISSPVILDHDGAVSRDFMVDGYPTLLILETHGRIAASYGSGWYQRDLSGLVDDLVSQALASRSLSHEPYEEQQGEYLPDPLPWERSGP